MKRFIIPPVKKAAPLFGGSVSAPASISDDKPTLYHRASGVCAKGWSTIICPRDWQAVHYRGRAQTGQTAKHRREV